MKMKHQNKFVIMLTVLLTISGCGQANQADNESIVLLDPKGVIPKYEVAAYHNIVNATSCPANVCPDVIKEYDMKDSIKFSSYLVAPNQQVSAGTPLIAGDTTDLDEQIKELEEEIADMEFEHLAYVEEATDKLDEPRKNLKFYYGLTIEYKDREPEFTEWGTKYQDTAIQVKQMEAKLNQAKELYELDHNYKLYQLQELKNKRQERILTADVSGIVLGMKNYQYGDIVPAYTSIIAVGDTNKKLIQCKFIPKADINLSQDIYAYFNGQKYPIEYIPMDDDEFNMRASKGEEVFSTFQLTEDTPDIQIGDRGAIVVVHKSRDNVLCVMKKSVQKDADGHYVYILQGEERVRVPVVIGAEDSLFVEILSGISAGDKVLTNETVKASGDTIQVTKGDLATEWKTDASFYFPKYSIVSNHVKYADCYYQETLVDLYQPVKKGDVLATIQVTPTDNEIQRKTALLTRQQERLGDLQTKYEKEDDLKLKKDIARSIAKKQREIDKINQRIAELQKDYESSEIIAPFDGIVIWRSDYKKDDKIAYNETLFHVVANDQCYMQISNDAGLMQYGEMVTISYKDEKNTIRELEGTIVTAGISELNNTIAEGRAIIQLPEDVMERVNVGVMNSSGSWTRNKITISAQITLIEGVYIVPSSYVDLVQRQTYIRVVEEDGHIYYQSVITGGIAKGKYAILAGVTEGTVLCCE